MNKNYSALIIRYEKQLEDNPRSRAFAPLAECYRAIGDTKKAFKILKDGIRYNSDYPLGFFILSKCYFDINKFDLAYTTIRSIVDVNKDNFKMLNFFGELCLKLKYEEEALDIYKYLLFVNPKNKQISEIVKKIENMNQLGSIILNYDSNDKKIEDNDKKFDVNNLILEKHFESSNNTDNTEWKPLDLNKINKNEIEKKEKFKIKVDLDKKMINKSKDEIKKDFSPVITHTLVDLYLGQGHIEKALEVLNKIIELRPDCNKSKEKFIEINSLNKVNNDKLVVFEESDKKDKILKSNELMNYFDKKFPLSDKKMASSEVIKDKDAKFQLAISKLLKFREAVLEKHRAI